MFVGFEHCQAPLVEDLLKGVKLLNEFIFLGFGQLLNLSRVSLDVVALFQTFREGYHRLFDNFASFYLLFDGRVKVL